MIYSFIVFADARFQNANEIVWEEKNSVVAFWHFPSYMSPSPTFFTGGTSIKTQAAIKTIFPSPKDFSPALFFFAEWQRQGKLARRLELFSIPLDEICSLSYSLSIYSVSSKPVKYRNCLKVLWDSWMIENKYENRLMERLWIVSQSLILFLA